MAQVYWRQNNTINFLELFVKLNSMNLAATAIYSLAKFKGCIDTFLTEMTFIFSLTFYPSTE